jgi:hypothetical protein
VLLWATRFAPVRETEASVVNLGLSALGKLMLVTLEIDCETKTRAGNNATTTPDWLETPVGRLFSGSRRLSDLQFCASRGRWETGD